MPGTISITPARSATSGPSDRGHDPARLASVILLGASSGQARIVAGSGNMYFTGAAEETSTPIFVQMRWSGVLGRMALAVTAAYLDDFEDKPYSMEEDFQRLASHWREQTKYDSSLSEMTSHPAYVAIMQLGQDVVPYMLRELQQTPDYWFEALATLTGEDPVPPSAYGDLPQMASAWLEWARGKGLVG